MTLARVMERAGEWVRRGLICDKCQKDPGLRASRGCGKAPVVRHGPGGVPVYWDVLKFLESEQRRVGRSAHIKDPKTASQQYVEARAGAVWENLGTLWDCCPAWYSRFYRGVEVGVADYASRLATAIRRDMLSLVYQGPPLPRPLYEQVAIAKNAQQSAQNIAERARIEADRRSDSGNGQRKPGGRFIRPGGKGKGRRR